MNDFLIDDAFGHFAASKNADYRRRVVERFFTFISFMQDNELTSRTILAQGENVSEQLKLMKSDFTDEGFEVIRLSYDKWLRGIDKGKSITDTGVLEKALSKVRRSHTNSSPQSR